MKIYSNDNINTTSTPFDQFVGKNIWVRCIYSHGTSDDFVYVRFLDREEWGYEQVLFDVSLVDPERLERYRSHREYYDGVSELSFIENKRIIALYLTLVSPVQIHTTEELFKLSDGELGEGGRILDRFSRTNVWFLATFLVGNDTSGGYYVHITKKQGDVLTVEYIASCYVDYTYESGDYQPPSDYIENCTIHVDSLRVVEPLEILTDEEFAEQMDANDEAFENGYYNDNEEEDEEE